MIAFGPIPSRRLGRSLGINHVPAKTCSYACTYCQVGRTTKMTMERQAFFRPEDILDAVRERVTQVESAGDRVDYLSFVPDGEPTLDINLGREIELLRPLGHKIAVISNASIIWQEVVRRDLGLADWVSLKVDGVEEHVWRRISRPHPRLDLDAILGGTKAFAGEFKGEFVSETMLVRGVNDSTGHLEALAEFLAGLAPATAYVSIPTRPPAEEGVRPPEEADIHRVFQVLSKRLDRVELLVGYEGDAFASTGDAEQDILSITAVHPMREGAVASLLERSGVGWSVVEKMLDEKQLLRVTYEGGTFYMRRLPSHQAP